MKQFKRVIQTEGQKKSRGSLSIKKNASVNHNFKIHQWKERKIMLPSTVERCSDVGNMRHLGSRLPCLLCFPSAQFSPGFLEFAFCLISVPACSRDSVNGSYYEHLFDRSLDCKEIQPVHSEGDQPWDSLEGIMLKQKLQYFGHLM